MIIKPDFRYIQLTSSQLADLIRMQRPGDEPLEIEMGTGLTGIGPKFAERIIQEWGCATEPSPEPIMV